MKTLPTDRHITYQTQYRRCGKPHCRCARGGAPHGPYRYAFWRDRATHKLISCYLGKPGQDQQRSA